MDIFIYFLVLTLGGLLGARGLIKPSMAQWLGKLQTISLMLLLYFLGIKVGLQDEMIASFQEIGFQALVLAAFSILFSVLAVRLVASRLSGEKGEHS